MKGSEEVLKEASELHHHFRVCLVMLVRGNAAILFRMLIQTRRSVYSVGGGDVIWKWQRRRRKGKLAKIVRK